MIAATAIGPGRNRIAALVVFVLILLVPVVWVTWSLHAAWLAGSAIESQSALLGQLRTRLAALDGRPVKPGDTADPATAFLPGATPAIAGAALQRLVADTVEAAGGRLIESEFARVEPVADDPGRVDLSVSFDCEIVSLQRIILDLESGMPMLLVRSADIRSTADAVENTSPPLRVTMLVGGYLDRQEEPPA